MGFVLETSNSELLARAKQAAVRYASERVTDCTVGVVFLGAIARGYFDWDADIDIAIFETSGKSETRINTELVGGFEIQTFVSDFEISRTASWDMSKRWAFSQSIIHFQRDNAISDLLKAKVTLGRSERIQLMKTGITLSEWYCNRLPDVWIRRNDLLSANYMFAEGLNHYLSALYSLNKELLADFKWRVYCTRYLEVVPSDFQNRLARLLRIEEISIDEVNRRREVFLSVWAETLPLIEEVVQMKYSEFRDTV